MTSLAKAKAMAKAETAERVTRRMRLGCVICLLVVSLFVLLGWWRGVAMQAKDKKAASKKMVFNFARCFQAKERYENRTRTLPRLEPARYAALDALRWNEALRHAVSRNYTIKGFYHVSTWRHYWSDVIEEQLLIMDGYRTMQGAGGGRAWGLASPATSSSPSATTFAAAGFTWAKNEQRASLLAASSQLYLNVAGLTDKDKTTVTRLVDNLQVLRHKSKIHVNFNHTVQRYAYKHAKPAEQATMRDSPLALSEGEYSTIDALHSHCKAEHAAGRRAIVYYLHNKGGCCSRKSSNFWDKTNDNVCSWREVMNAFAIEFPSICLRALLAGYTTCGYDFLIDFHIAHYSGNFWWADCAHVALLPRLHDRFDSFKAELFLFNMSSTDDSSIGKRYAETCAFSTFNCCVDSYKQQCPSNTYLARLTELLTLPSMSHFSNHNQINSSSLLEAASSFVGGGDLRSKAACAASNSHLPYHARSNVFA